MIDEKKLKKELAELSLKCPFSVLDERFALYTECFEKAICLLKEQPKVNEWISVEERLPEEQTDYKGIKRSSYHLVTVIAYGKPKISIDYIVNGIWHLEEGNTVLKVSAWKPLPEPYKKEVKRLK